MTQSANAATSPSNNAIARSRSRYKGSRLGKLHVAPSSPLEHDSTRLPQLYDLTTGVDAHCHSLTACGQRKCRRGKLDANNDDQVPKKQENPKQDTTTDLRSSDAERKGRYQRYVYADTPDDLTKGALRLRECDSAHFTSQHMCHGNHLTERSVSTPLRDAAYAPGAQGTIDKAASTLPLIPSEKDLIHTWEQHPRTHKISTRVNETKKTISGLVNTTVATKPAFDAPVSAINTGERSVRVKYDKNVVSVAVTPSTTVIDVIHHMSSRLSIPVPAKTLVLLESFKKIGVERPLRRYERIRDVLNSVCKFRACSSLLILSVNCKTRLKSL